jgi:hypothetical protein
MFLRGLKLLKSFVGREQLGLVLSEVFYSAAARTVKGFVGLKQGANRSVFKASQLPAS